MIHMSTPSTVMAPRSGMSIVLDYGGSSHKLQAQFFMKEHAPGLLDAYTRGRRQLPGLGAAVLYGLCSTSMAFMNKAILTSYHFDYPFTILVLQMIFTILVLEMLKRLGKTDYPTFTLSDCRSFLFPSMCYALNAVLGLYALGKMNIPMYGVLKRCTPVVSLVLAYFMLKKGLPSRAVVMAVLMMTLGCVIAGSGDLTFNMYAYVCGALSNVTQALYLTLVQRYSEKRSTVETLYLNSVNTLPFLLAMCFLKGEPFQVLYHPYIFKPTFLFALFSVTALGCLLNYSMFLCTALNSALTTTVVGMFKTIAQTTLGFFAFGGVRVNAVLLVGVIMNLSGGILYAAAKYRDSRKRPELPQSNKDLMKNSREDLSSCGRSENDNMNGNAYSGGVSGLSNGHCPNAWSSAYYAGSRERKPSESFDDDHQEHIRHGGEHGSEINR